MHSEDQAALERLESRVRAILPEQYQDYYDEVKPVSMGSAGLKYGPDGGVAWDRMWGSFCDLAMAGGPPHKGTLLEPGCKANIDAEPGRYKSVVEEICRGITMVTDLPAESAQEPGWISVDCVNHGTAAWLLRAITVENVSVRCEGGTLYLPAAPSYRLEKEVKNVITVIAKTSHYWFGHTSQVQRRRIGELFQEMENESPLVQPAFSSSDLQTDSHQNARTKMAENINRLAEFRISTHEYASWLGVECPDVRSAIWMMRGMIASNVLSRREDTVLFIPVDPCHDPNGEIGAENALRLYRFGKIRGIL